MPLPEVQDFKHIEGHPASITTTFKYNAPNLLLLTSQYLWKFHSLFSLGLELSCKQGYKLSNMLLETHVTATRCLVYGGLLAGGTVILLPLGGHAHPGCLCTKQALGACASKLLENGLGTRRRTSYLLTASGVGTLSPTWTTAVE